VTISGVTFSNCAAVNGGAILVSSGGILTVSNCTFIGNNASGPGGAVAVSAGGIAQFDGCTFVSNHAANGGAIDTFGDVNLDNCTIVSNTASSTGGGLRLESGSGSLAVNSCTIVGNSAANGGGVEDDDGGGTLTARNSIIAHNSTGGSGPDVRTFMPGFSSSGYNLISRTNDGTGWRHNGLSDDDQCGSVLGPLYPLLARLADNGGCTCTMALLPGSPAIDAGSSGGMTYDQRGFLRPTNILGSLSPPDDASDIGAFEVQTTDLTNAPLLKIFANGANAILLWDSKAAAYTLEQASPLNPPASWTPVAATPALTNANAELTVTQPASATNKFFRLRAP
jgi:hypothetical protein